MSLINDALRRASKKDKETPREAPVGAGMEPVPPAKGSRSNAMLGVLALVVLLLAGWFFWQWWTVRNKAQTAAAAGAKVAAHPGASNAVPGTAAATNRTGTITFVREKKAVAPAVATAPSAPGSPVATTSPTAPESTTTIITDAPAAPAPVVAQAPATPAAPAPAPVYVDERISLPVDLTLSAILFNRTDPHALINGQLYGIGDVIQGGVTIKAIERNRVIMEWNGHTKILMVGE